MHRVTIVRRTLLDGLLIALGAAIIAVVFNAARSEGIPLIRNEAYAILVPCPETSGEVEHLTASRELLSDSKTLLVDARLKEQAAANPIAGALRIPYDYLEETPTSAVERIAASGAARVAVFGDGGIPDAGEQLAKEISGRGIRNVGFIKGGAAAVHRVLGAVPEGDTP